MTALSGTMATRAVSRALPLPNTRWLFRLAWMAIVVLAAVLRFANLSALGYANHYYTAAVQAMLQSWHNFFFVAAEPGGSVSVDKPPVGLWLQAISAFIFGVNGFGVLLPQLVAGVLSVIVIYHLVRRKFGQVAGLVASLALAITPVVVATDRNNTIDSTLILTLLLATWAFMKATESMRLRYLLLGVVLVGIGFNIKMLEAYLPLPAFYALYFLGSSERLWKKIGKLSLATVLLLVVSMSWATIVDLTPADQRPYVGSSSDNSEWSLILGYNGVQRLLGMGGNGGALTSILGGNSDGNARGAMQSLPPGQDGTGSFQPRRDGTNMPPVPQGDGLGQPPQGGGPGGGTGGIFNTGNPGALRLFIAPLSNQMSWLLPFGILSAILLAIRSRLHWPIADKHQALVLWGVWLLTGGVFFSIAGFFHEYYLSMLAPALAALVGIGIVELWSLRTKHPWISSGILIASAVATCAFQYYTAAAFIRSIWWWPVAAGALLVGAITLLASRMIKSRRAAIVGFTYILGAMMLTPGIWSGLTTLEASTNQTLPAAYNGGQASFGPVGQGGANTQLTGVQIDQALLSYLEANTQGVRYLMAVPSSMQGADYVIATGRPVLYLGGFNGQDQVETADSLSQLVAKGELRFIYLGGQGGGPGGMQSNVSTWVTTNCTLIQGYDTSVQNQGAPDGSGSTSATANSSPGGMQVSLYRCGG